MQANQFVHPTVANVVLQKSNRKFNLTATLCRIQDPEEHQNPNIILVTERTLQPKQAQIVLQPKQRVSINVETNQVTIEYNP